MLTGGGRVRWGGAAGAVVLACALAPRASAQADPSASLVTVSVAPESVTVGERFTVRIRVRAPKVATIRFPDVPEAAGGVDPIDPRAIEEGPPGDVLDRTAAYTFVAWDIGRRAPAFGPVVVSVAGRDRSFALTPVVDVRSLLPADSASLVPRDARPPVPLPSGAWRFILLGALLVAGIAWYWWHRRREALDRESEKVPEAWQHARDGFAALEKLALADAGELGRHVIAHVDVLRGYLARRFPTVGQALDAPRAAAALAELDFPVPLHRVAALLDRDAELRFAREPISATESAALATEARDIAALVQLAHEARLRALERPPRPRRR